MDIGLKNRICSASFSETNTGKIYLNSSGTKFGNSFDDGKNAKKK